MDTYIVFVLALLMFAVVVVAFLTIIVITDILVRRLKADGPSVFIKGYGEMMKPIIQMLKNWPKQS